jgi:hypothetical protein
MLGIRRREFITLLVGAAGWAIAARAQLPAIPVIGYLASTAPGPPGSRLEVAFREGLRKTGFVVPDGMERLRAIIDESFGRKSQAAHAQWVA